MTGLYVNGRKSALIKASLILVALIAVSAAWRFTAIGEWINLTTIIKWQASVKNHPLALLFVVAAYVAAGLVFFPVTILSVASVFTFGPILGNLYSLAGWLASAAMGYGLGRAFGHNLFHKTAGARLEYYLRSDRHGFFTVFLIRLLPVAPFTLANMFIGASTIRFRDFMLGSTAGRIPGMIMLGFAGVQIEMLLSNPALKDVVLLIIAVFLLPLVVWWVSNRFVLAHERRSESISSRKTSSIPAKQQRTAKPFA